MGDSPRWLCSHVVSILTAGFPYKPKFCPSTSGLKQPLHSMCFMYLFNFWIKYNYAEKVSMITAPFYMERGARDQWVNTRNPIQTIGRKT